MGTAAPTTSEGHEMQATATIRPSAPKCEARTGYAAGEFGEVPVWCLRSIALGSFEDAQGVIRHACQAPGHRAMVERLYGVWEPRAALDAGTAIFDDWETRKAAMDREMASDLELMLDEFHGAIR